MPRKEQPPLHYLRLPFFKKRPWMGQVSNGDEFSLILVISVLALVVAYDDGERFREKLVVRPLPDHSVLLHFQFEMTISRGGSMILIVIFSYWMLDFVKKCWTYFQNCQNLFWSQSLLLCTILKTFGILKYCFLTCAVNSIGCWWWVLSSVPKINCSSDDQTSGLTESVYNDHFLFPVNRLKNSICL